MSLTLHAFGSLQALHGHDLAQTVEYVARGGRRGRHFFFFGGGGGLTFLLVPLALLFGGGRYLMKNPDKAHRLKERLKGAWNQRGTLNSYRDPSTPHYGFTPPQYGPPTQQPLAPGPHPPQAGWPSPPVPPQASGPAQPVQPAPPPSASASRSGAAMRFNPPPGWPVPPGWTPSAKSQPDPSWPPPPPGWQFWVQAS